MLCVLQSGNAGYFHMAVTCFESLLGAHVKCCDQSGVIMCYVSRKAWSGLSSGDMITDHIMDSSPASGLFV